MDSADFLHSGSKNGQLCGFYLRHLFLINNHACFYLSKFYVMVMALEIRPIPTLKGQETLAFALAAERATKVRGQ